MLWVTIPEVRNIGTKMATEFFLHNQTVFYFQIQDVSINKDLKGIVQTKIDQKSSNQFISDGEIHKNKKLLPKFLKTLLKYRTSIHIHKPLNHITEKEPHKQNGEDSTTIRFDTIEEMRNAVEDLYDKVTNLFTVKYLINKGF